MKTAINRDSFPGKKAPSAALTFFFVIGRTYWDTLAGFSQDFVWDFVHQLLLLSKPNAILGNKGFKSY